VATIRAREAVSWARLSALAIAVPTSSVKPARRCSVSAGNRPRAPATIAPHSRPSTTIGTATPDRIPRRRTASPAMPEARMTSSLRAGWPVRKAIAKASVGSRLDLAHFP
jgi:hypothetical protein